MTNEELLNYPGSARLLTTIEKQKHFLLRQAARAPKCLNCHTPVSEFEALGVAVNDYSFDAGDGPYRCPHCQRELLRVLPPFSSTGWYWVPGPGPKPSPDYGQLELPGTKEGQ